MSARSSTVGTIAALVLACCLALALGITAVPASAGDGVTLIYFESDEVDSSGGDITLGADAGETITLDLVVSDHGDYNSNGIDELSATIAYSPDVFEVTDVEHGPMLAAGSSEAEVEGAVEIDDEGTITIDQERTPSGDGAMTTDAIATITIDVAEDAEPTTETLEVADASATLVTDYPRNFVDREATIHVEGGEPDAESDDEGDGDDDGPDGVTLADDDSDDEDAADDDSEADAAGGDDTDDATEGDAGAADDGGDGIPGFAVPAALVAIAAWLGLRIRR